jgi:two-component system, LytTR family, response regulator
MKAIIIDDEPLARMMVKEYLQAYPHITVMQECSDGYEGMKAIQLHKPDLIFLDIQMPKITGFEMLELLDEPPLVIFTTAFEEYAIKAFDAHAADYLLKPFSKDRFDKAIQKVMGQTSNNAKLVTDTALTSYIQSNRIVVKENGKIKIIPIAQLKYLEAADDYIKIHTGDEVYLKKKTMQYFEDSLPKQEFIRIHRSYIVNAQLITRVDLMEKESYSLLLTTGIRLPVSKTGYSKLKIVLGL